MIDLKAFRIANHLTQSELAEYLDVGQSFISQIEKGVRPIPAEYISKIYANENWDNSTLKISSEVLKSEQQKKSDEIETRGKLIPFYDAEAAAGNSYEMDMLPSRPVGMIEIGSVLRDCESAIRVYGNSMVPNYPAGCVIGLKLHTDSFIEPGRVYVVETRDNRYLKRLYYTKDKKSFHCLSDNTMKYEDGPRKGELYYQDFEIPIDEVVRLHRVVGVIKRNIL